MSDLTAPADLPLLQPGTPVLVRPGNRVHVGSDPHRSLLIELTEPVLADDVAALIRGLAEPGDRGRMLRRARSVGLTQGEFTRIVGQLVAAGKTVPTGRPGSSARLRVRVHGQGPIADLLTSSLAEVGHRPARSARRPIDMRSVRGWDCNLVVLTDYLVHDPAIVTALTGARIPHLPVRVRDGVGVIGPLVLPGLSSCLRCADIHRTMLDPDWPLLAAQLLNRPGHAGAGTIRGTAAVAQAQIEQIGAALMSGDTTPPQLMNRAMELHAGPIRLETTSCPPHPCCACRPTTALAC